MLIPDWNDIADESIIRDVRAGRQPVVLRQLVKHWTVVQRGLQGFASLAEYLTGYDSGKSFEAMIAPTSANGRLFYKYGDYQKFNFDRVNGKLPDALEILGSLSRVSPAPTFYVGSKKISEYLPGLERETPLQMVEDLAEPTIWIGNAVTIATHNDNSENIACVAAGRRRFTLFPPDQERNLYIGPRDNTPSGRPISMVNLKQPDYAQYPLFRYAMEESQTAELGPGDAIYIPTHWWHNVESLDPVNILINFWWQGDPPSFI